MTEDNTQALAGAASELNAELGIELSKVTDPHLLQRLVVKLWNIIDSIDSASDVAKNNDDLYREIVHKWQKKRHKYVKTDGYGFFVVGKKDDNTACAVMKCGAVVSNVYEAYEAGILAERERLKQTINKTL